MKGKLLYEGKAKKIYECGTSTVILEFKDDATAGNKAKHDVFAGKGQLNCAISSGLMKHLKTKQIDTHFIDQISDNEQICHRVNIIPIEVIVRNTAAGTFCKRYGVDIGTELGETIVEFCVKDDDLNDPLIDPSAIAALGIATHKQIHNMRETAKLINRYLRDIFENSGAISLETFQKTTEFKLIDFKLEFGTMLDQDMNDVITKDRIVLADEICPDTMRLWNENNESFDKDLFRNNSGDLLAGYQYVADFLSQKGICK